MIHPDQEIGVNHRDIGQTFNVEVALGAVIVGDGVYSNETLPSAKVSTPSGKSRAVATSQHAMVVVVAVA